MLSRTLARTSSLCAAVLAAREFGDGGSGSPRDDRRAPPPRSLCDTKLGRTHDAFIVTHSALTDGRRA
jgi:hypothetical protein